MWIARPFRCTIRRRVAQALALPALLAVLGAPRVSGAQEPTADDERLAATWHRVAGRALDYARVAEQARTVRQATPFDRPEVQAAEVARLRALVDGAQPAHEFTLRVHDRISEYDHARGEFSIGLFTPGTYVPVRAFGQEYQVVFANAEGARPIAMARDAARPFDQRLNAMGRGVLNELRFRIVGTGDPAGGVTGDRVVRAELLGSRLLDQNGAVVHVPTVTPLAVAAGAGAGGGATDARTVPAFDAARTDVAGFRVGVRADDLAQALERLFGPVQRRAATGSLAPRLATVLAVNESGCRSSFDRRSRAAGAPGAVCVTAWADGDGVVRAIRVERVFPWLEAEAFRRTLVARYGPVDAAQGSGGLALGWGPDVDAALRYGGGPGNALTARYEQDQDFMRRGMNALPRIRVVLQLVDAAWASERAR